MKLEGNNMIIGNVSSFGIEVDLNKKDNMLVPLRLFIKNNPIGTLDDYTYVISFINNFMFKLGRLFELDINLKEFDELNVFNYIHSLVEDLDKYRLKLGDSFDDYYIYVYMYNDKTYLTWKIVDAPFFTYDKNQIYRVFSCDINIHEIQGVVKDLKYLMGMNN